MLTPEQDSFELPMNDDPQQLLAKIIEYLQQEDANSLNTIILEQKLKDESIFWDLILKIGNCINAETSEKNPSFFDVCYRCLMYLVKAGNPKETLLALLEQVDTFIDDVKFEHFLKPIQTALMKIPSKLFHSLDITLETVSSHLRSLELPENTQLEGDEVKLFHVDKTVVRLANILYAYLKFLEPFVNAVDVHLENMTPAAKQEALVLKKHLIRLFEHPLCHLVLTYNPSSEKAKSDSRLCAELAMTLFSKVETDFHRFMKNAIIKNKEKTNKEDKVRKDTRNFDEEDYNSKEDEQISRNSAASEERVTDVVEQWNFKMEVTPLAKACLAYLIHVEHLGLQKYPAVYRHDYILDFYLEVISNLLKNTVYPINHKGLLLCKALTEVVLKNTIAVDYLDNPLYMSVINDLIHIMVKCPVRDHRTLATEIFPLFVSRFVIDGRYQIYQNILISCDHSSMKGYVITLIKNDLNDSLKNALSFSTSGQGDEKKNKDSEKGLEYFSGKKLEKLLKLAASLPAKETTDMLENYNQIISSLNLLRFLILADPPTNNITGFWDILPTIEKDFLSPLLRGLDLSKAHYVLELNTRKEGKKSETGHRMETEMSVSVEGMTLPMLEEKEQIGFFEKAINAHDVMLSLHARVSELIDQQRRLLMK